MLSDLENYVLKLHDCLSSSQYADLPTSIISDIIYTCGENANAQSICNFCLFFFLNKTYLLN